MTFKFSNGRKCWKFAKGVRERERERKMSERRCDGMENFLGNLDIFRFSSDSNCWKFFLSRKIAKKYTRDIYLGFASESESYA